MRGENSRDELGRVVQVEDGKDHKSRHSSIRRGSTTRARAGRVRLPLLIDPRDRDPPERRVGGGQEGAKERDGIDRRVDLGDPDNVKEELFRERDAAAHAGVGEDGEHGKDGPDDS